MSILLEIHYIKMKISKFLSYIFSKLGSLFKIK